ncbi:choice-of-anchor M domain-containing protein [Rhodopirellula islandica]|nr:choice-of-anchor M domain-containing protein [Rhodopirellula islandica]
MSFLVKNFALVCCIGMLCLQTENVSAATLTEYSSGHADIGLAYEDGELNLHYHFGGGAVLNGVALAAEAEFNPTNDGVYVRVPNTSSASFTSVPSGLEFTGMNPDGTPAIDFWVLPQVTTAGVPFLGFGTGELNSADWDNNLSFRLTDVQFTPQGDGVAGQGYFSVYQPGSTGGFDVNMDSLNGFDSSDEVEMAPNGHDHFVWGFTEQGLYEVTLEASGTHINDGFKSDTETFLFAVGNSTAVTAVPEPGSLAVLASLGIAGMLVRRRRRPQLK